MFLSISSRRFTQDHDDNDCNDQRTDHRGNDKLARLPAKSRLDFTIVDRLRARVEIAQALRCENHSRLSFRLKQTQGSR